MIPDQISVFGYLDDVILLPLGVMLAISCIPPEVLSERRQKVDEPGILPPNHIAAFVIVAIWLSVIVGILIFLV